MKSVGKKSKINIIWKVDPYDYSKDKLNSIISIASKKYGISKENIKVIPEFKMVNQSGEFVGISNDIISNIQNTEFQLILFIIKCRLLHLKIQLDFGKITEVIQKVLMIRQ